MKKKRNGWYEISFLGGLITALYGMTPFLIFYTNYLGVLTLGARIGAMVGMLFVIICASVAKQKGKRLFSRYQDEKKRGFTLIELLVVISIIGLLSSIVFAGVHGVSTKASDTRRIADMRGIQKALVLFFTTYGRMPRNYNGGTDAAHPQFYPGGVPSNLDSWGACDAPMPGLPGGGAITDDCTSSACANPTFFNNNGQAYNASMQELVNAGFLSRIPHSNAPDGPGYCYFDNGPGKTDGTIVVTLLPNTPPSTTGLDGSCRPYPSSGGTWCESGKANTSLCYCFPY